MFLALCEHGASIRTVLDLKTNSFHNPILGLLSGTCTVPYLLSAVCFTVSRACNRNGDFVLHDCRLDGELLAEPIVWSFPTQFPSSVSNDTFKPGKTDRSRTTTAGSDQALATSVFEAQESRVARKIFPKMRLDMQVITDGRHVAHPILCLPAWIA